MLWITLLKTILLGVVEGITEWLPISSTGHLILLENILSLDVSPAFRELFDVVIQLGAVSAVLLISRQELNPFSRRQKKKEKQDTLRLWGMILLGVFPSAVAGLLLDDLISRYLYNPLTVSLMLTLWGIGFMWMDHRAKSRSPRITDTNGLCAKDAAAVGCFQVFSLIPGTSRSGATIFGGLLLGLSRSTASRFSFFLAIPTMLGASLLKGAKYFWEGNMLRNEEIMVLGVGSLCAFLVSLVTLRFLTEYVRTHGFFAFGVYRILLGLTLLLFHFF